MRKFTWDKFIHSWWGRSLAGAFIGFMVVAFASPGGTSPLPYVLGMFVGAVALFLLGRLQ